MEENKKTKEEVIAEINERRGELKARKKDKKTLLKKAGAVLLTLAATVVSFAACNNPSQSTPEPTPTPTPTPVEQVAVVSILNANTAYKNMNDSAADIIYDEIKEAVAEEYSVAKNKVELCSVRIDGEGYQPTTVVAKIDNKKVVLLQYETDAINEHLPRDIESLVLSEAGYTANDKVDQDKQSQVDAEFTSAVNAILARFATISDEITLVKANEIFSEYSSTTSVPGFESCEGIILSDVREDGTAVAFTYEYGVYKDHVLKVEGRENMTDAEIMVQIKAGNFTKETRTIDPSKTYTAPAVEEKPVVEYVNFNEIYNEIFGEDFSFTSPTELFDSVLPTIQTYATSTELIMYATGDNLDLYSEYMNKFGQTNLTKITYQGENYEAIKQYCDLYSESSESLKEYLKVKLAKDDIVKGSADEAALRTELEKYGTYALNGQQYIKSLAKEEFLSEKIITATEDEVDNEAFGEKLCPDKEVIATYVGAMGPKALDSTKMFNTGYFASFNTVVIYKEDKGDVVIKQDKIYVPYYNDSTNESLYKTFSEGKDETKYNVISQETETIENATVAKQYEKQKLASIQVLNEYDIESPDEESAKIVADAVAAYFADELAR